MGVEKRLHQSLRNRHATPTLRMRSVMAVRCACLRTFLDFGLFKVEEQMGAAGKRVQDYATLTRLAAAAKPFRSLINPADARFVSPDNMPAKITAYCRRRSSRYRTHRGHLFAARLKVWRSSTGLRSVSLKRFPAAGLTSCTSWEAEAKTNCSTSLRQTHCRFRSWPDQQNARLWVMCWCKRLRWATCLRWLRRAAWCETHLR